MKLSDYFFRDINEICNVVCFQVTAYEARKAEAEAQHKKLEPNALVRPKIKFFSCLESFLQNEIINNFYSTAVKGNVFARKSVF